MTRQSENKKHATDDCQTATVTHSKKAAVGRRQLLVGATVGAAAVGGGLAVAGCSSPDDIRWDLSTDIAVLGSGTGLAGALAASATGLEVVVLEKRAVIGGNTGISGGVAWVPNNSLMRARGISDSRAMALTYLRQNAGNQAGEELLQAYADQAPAMADFIQTKSGVVWRLSKILDKVSDYHPEWPGSVVWGRSIEPDIDGAWLLGGHLINGLMQGIDRAGIRVMTETPAQQLIASRKGPLAVPEVIGVMAMRNGQPFNIRTRRGVLMATGGFEHNSELKQHFLRGPSPYTFGTPGNTGDGLRMAMAVGADLRNMNELWGISVYKPEAELALQGKASLTLTAQIEKRRAGCIAVNRYGERFCNEAGSYDAGWRSYLWGDNSGTLGYRNLPAFHLFDYRVRRNGTIHGKTAGQPLPDWIIQANSLKQLAGKLGIDVAGLQRTVKDFNKNARRGVDPKFHRGESVYDRTDADNPHTAGPEVTLAPLDQPPFFGVEVAPADTGTCGGARVNANAQVLDPFNRVIKGLYASGNCAGIGAPGTGYGGGGGTIGPALTFAYIAGKHLAGPAG